MVQVKTNGIVEQLCGSVGGDYYRIDHVGLHIQAQPRKIKRCSPAQNKRRRNFRATMRHRRIAWYQGHGQAWDRYAATHTATNKIGGRIHLTATNWFLKINLYRIFNDLDPIYDPPND